MRSPLDRLPAPRFLERHGRRLLAAAGLAACAACSASGADAPPGGGDPAAGSGGGPATVTTPAAGGAAPAPADTTPVFVPPPGTGGSTSVDSGTHVVREPCETAIVAKIRDFQPTHPDFERPIDFLAVFTGDHGIVLPDLVSGYPAYARASGGTPTTTGLLEFYPWYVDTPGVNQTFEVTLQLVEKSPGLFVYDTSAFFPIDGRGFGNGSNPHNFHFTTELRTSFTYSGGETFTFRGDDDLWMFVNGHQAIDLGGTHPAQAATVNMDAEAGRLGLVAGQSYPMDIFHAERHTTESNFHIETSIRCFKTVTPPPPPPPPIPR